MLSDTWEAFYGIGTLYAARTPRKRTYTARLVLLTESYVTKSGFATIDEALAWGHDMVAAIEKAMEAQGVKINYEYSKLLRSTYEFSNDDIKRALLEYLEKHNSPFRSYMPGKKVTVEMDYDGEDYGYIATVTVEEETDGQRAEGGE